MTNKSSERELINFLEKIYHQRLPRSVNDKILKGEISDAIKSIREWTSKPLVEAITDKFKIDKTQVSKAISEGNFNCLFELLVPRQPYSSLVINVSNAANLMCGSIIEYRQGREISYAAIARTSAWKKIGGNDQLLVNANPGTIGLYHSDKMGGYDVGLISAHTIGKTGAVAIWEIINIVNGELRGKVKSKTQIANDFGFNKLTGRNIFDESSGLQLKLRDVNTSYVNIGGSNFSIVGENVKVSNGPIACYRLEKLYSDNLK